MHVESPQLCQRFAALRAEIGLVVHGGNRALRVLHQATRGRAMFETERVSNFMHGDFAQANAGVATLLEFALAAVRRKHAGAAVNGAQAEDAPIGKCYPWWWICQRR